MKAFSGPIVIKTLRVLPQKGWQFLLIMLRILYLKIKIKYDVITFRGSKNQIPF
jgi:hypothetical protein